MALRKRMINFILVQGFPWSFFVVRAFAGKGENGIKYRKFTKGVLPYECTRPFR